MSPLLFRHLNAVDFPCPDSFRRSLRLLYLRHQRTNDILIKTLQRILFSLEKEGIRSLVLKGAALCHTIYPEMALRPMRDIDIMVAEEEAEHAQSVVISLGFTESDSNIPPDHFHLPSLHAIVDGMPVCIELHRGLFATSCPPYTRPLKFEDLCRTSTSFETNGVTAHTFGNEEMLWYLYQHGFCMPLSYDRYKIINAADIISFVEAEFDVLDWEKIQISYPEVLHVLPLFHHLTPWQKKVEDTIMQGKRSKPSGIGQPFQGWPQLRLKEQQGKSFLNIIFDTFWPSEWWLKMYYGISGRTSYSLHRLFIHPRHIFWWIRLYAPHLIKNDPAGNERNDTWTTRISQSRPVDFFKTVAAFIRKFQ